MIDSLTEILTGTGLTINSTNATDIQINLFQDRQTTKEQIISSILNYTDHIGYETGTTFKIVDLLTGATETTLNTYAIKNINASLQNQVYNRIEADLTVKEFQRQDNGTPALVDKIVTRSIDTGFSGGTVLKVTTLSQPTILSGGEIVYDYTDIDAVLTRKKTLYLRHRITLTIDGFLSHSYGDKLNFTDYDEKTDSNIASGYLIVTGFSYNDKNTTTTYEGIGEYVYL